MVGRGSVTSCDGFASIDQVVSHLDYQTEDASPGRAVSKTKSGRMSKSTSLKMSRTTSSSPQRGGAATGSGSPSPQSMGRTKSSRKVVEKDEEPVRSSPMLPAYFSRKEPAQAKSNFKPSAQEMLWSKHPAHASDIHPVEGFHFQALPCRATPHQPEGATKRWPDGGTFTGGLIHPSDGRKHAHWFGYVQRREKRMAFRAPAGGSEEPMSITLDIIKQVLTHCYGNLKAAFNRLDFFQDSRLSPLEWQEGLNRAFAAYTGPDSDRCRKMAEVKEIFNKRLKEIFKQIDDDGDGLISFEELVQPRIQATEAPHDFTRRRASETMGAEAAEDMRLRLERSYDRSQMPEAKKARAMSPSASRRASTQSRRQSYQSKVQDVEASDALRAFAALMMQSFPTCEAAFRAMDINNSEQLTMNEFTAGAVRRLHYTGDTRTIFKELDADGNGSLSLDEFTLLRGLKAVEVPQSDHEMTKKEVVAARRLRSPITGPAPHARGLCIAGSSHTPMTERMANGAGFHSFNREPTGRLDDLIHPDEYPGVDRDWFHATTGPGYCARGPESFHLGECAHPLQGNQWKFGATMDRVERFGRLIPCKEARVSEELGSTRYQNYQGLIPKEGPGHWGSASLAATAMQSSSLRRGPTMGSADAFGLMAPKPIGKWGDTRATLHIKTKSEPCLLKKVV